MQKGKVIEKRKRQQFNAYLTQDLKSAITDSGANVSITNQQVVDHYSLPVFKLPEPAHVKLDDIIQSEQEFICMGGIQEFK